MKGGLLTAWLAEVVIITYRTVSRGSTGPISHLPLPSTYVSTMIVYGGLGLLPESANVFSTAVGWGLVVATVLNLWQPGSKTTAAGTPTVTTAPQVAAQTGGSKNG